MGEYLSTFCESHSRWGTLEAQNPFFFLKKPLTQLLSSDFGPLFPFRWNGPPFFSSREECTGTGAGHGRSAPCALEIQGHLSLKDLQHSEGGTLVSTSVPFTKCLLGG